MGYEGMGYEGMGYEGMRYEWMGYEGIGYEGMGYEGMGYEGMGYELTVFVIAEDCTGPQWSWPVAGLRNILFVPEWPDEGNEFIHRISTQYLLSFHSCKH